MKSIKDNPCHGCKPPKRSAGCHAKCMDYIIAKVFHEVERAAAYEEHEVNQYTLDSARKNRDRFEKRKRDFKGHTWRRSG